MLAFQTSTVIRKPTYCTPNWEISLIQSIRIPGRWGYDFHQLAGHTLELQLGDPAEGLRTEEGYIDQEKLPKVWEICYCCQGHGKSSAYLGDYTMSEFNEAFDPDEQEDYFNGAYDRACMECSGTGKVFRTNADSLPESLAMMVRKREQDELDWAAEQAAERRYGC